MNEPARLIELAQGGGPDARKAVSRLAALGMKALLPVVEAIRQSPRSSAGPLGDVIRQLHEPEVVPTLVTFLDEPKIGLVVAVFDALGASGDGRALRPLVGYLVDTTHGETRRALAAEALGNLGFGAAIDSLLRVTDDATKNKQNLLALAGVKALAKLGNHERARLAVSLVTYKRDPTVRIDASDALQYAVAPGMIPALESAVRDRIGEVRENALDALFYLGAREVMGSLISAVGSRDPTTSGRARLRIQDLWGEELDDEVSVKELRNWWGSHEDEYRSGVTYRLGRPIWLPDVIGLLEEPNGRGRILKELHVITGINFGVDGIGEESHEDQVQRRAREIWDNNQLFERGALYKWGHRQDLSALV